MIKIEELFCESLELRDKGILKNFDEMVDYAYEKFNQHIMDEIYKALQEEGKKLDYE